MGGREQMARSRGHRAEGPGREKKKLTVNRE